MIYRSDLTPLQQDILDAKICPYCYSQTVKKTEQEVYGKTYKGRTMICCKNFPHCDSYVGTHEDGLPLGRLANQKHRLLKKKVHNSFDAIWENNYMSRSEAYKALGEFMGLGPELTHIGMFNEKSCEKAARWALELYVKLSK